MENVPGWLQVLGAVAIALGGKEVVVGSFNWLTGRKKAAGEMDAQNLENEKNRMDQLVVMTDKVKELLAQSELREEQYRQQSRDLANERDRVTRRDAVIAYQKEEVQGLHESYTQIREQMAVMQHQMATMAKAQDELTTLTMRQSATLEKLKSEGKWEGFQNGETHG